MSTQPETHAPEAHDDAIEQHIQLYLGQNRHEWMAKPNRHLAGLAPYDLLGTDAGARIVLAELKRGNV
jgi:uncharacterized protein (DUF2384 family)